MKTRLLEDLLQELRAKLEDGAARQLLDEIAQLALGAENYFATHRQTIEEEIELLKKFASLDEDEARFRLARQTQEQLQLRREAARKAASLEAARLRILELERENELLGRARLAADSAKAKALSQWDFHIGIYDEERKLLAAEAEKIEHELKRLDETWERNAGALSRETAADKQAYRDGLIQQMTRALTEQKRLAGNEERLILSGLFHFIRNQVDGVSGAARLLQERASQMIPEAAARFHLPATPELEKELELLARVLQENMQAMDRLRAGLSEFSALAQSAELNLAPTDLSEFIGEYLESRQEKFAAAQARAQPELSQAPPALADRIVLKAILDELVDNAFDAQPAGRPIRFETFSEENWCGIVLRDSGPGIPAHLRAKIFYPFFSTKEGHSGLGLTRALRMAAWLGGTLEALPSDAGGAFRLRLPAQPIA